jgi:hypothetical protein
VSRSGSGCEAAVFTHEFWQMVNSNDDQRKPFRSTNLGMDKIPSAALPRTQ